jgi:hypothetical protein
MQVSRHAGAKPEDRLFPPLHKMTEGGVVVRRLDPPHRLLVGHREQRQQQTQFSHGLPRLVWTLWHGVVSHRIFFAVVRDKKTG